MHQFEPLADELERLAEPLLERRMQFLVDRPAHLVELGGIVRLDGGQPSLDGQFQALEALVEAERKAVQVAGKRFEAFGLQGAELGDLGGHRLAEQVGRLGAFLAVTKSLLGILAPVARQFLAQFALEAIEPLLLRRLQRAQGGLVVAPPPAAQQQDYLQQDDDDDAGEQHQGDGLAHVSAQRKIDAAGPGLVVGLAFLVGPDLGRQQEDALGRHLALLDQPALDDLRATQRQLADILVAGRLVGQHQLLHFRHRQILLHADHVARLGKLRFLVGPLQIDRVFGGIDLDRVERDALAALLQLLLQLLAP